MYIFRMNVILTNIRMILRAKYKKARPHIQVAGLESRLDVTLLCAQFLFCVVVRHSFLLTYDMVHISVVCTE